MNRQDLVDLLDHVAEALVVLLQHDDLPTEAEAIGALVTQFERSLKAFHLTDEELTESAGLVYFAD